MTREDVDRWLADYVEAWMTYDRDKVEALFAEDIAYRYHPEDEPITGREAVVESWLGEGDHANASDRDEPGTYEAEYRVFAVDGDAAVATGVSSYRDERGRRDQAGLRQLLRDALRLRGALPRVHGVVPRAMSPASFRGLRGKPRSRRNPDA